MTRVVQNDGQTMRFRMLGLLRVLSRGGWTRVAAEQPRVVLAVLLAEAGRPVSAERLIDAVWEDHPPRTAANTVAAYVLRLRRLIGAEAIVTRRGGYELVAGADDVDAVVFERTLAAARRALGEAGPEVGAVRLGEALALWPGPEPALADVPSRPLLVPLVAHLEQLRSGAVEDHVGALLELGRHAEVVDELYRLTGEQPLRERRWELLLTALHRSDRRADALAAYREARRILADELGVEPGPRLREAHEAVLAGQPPAMPVAAGRPLVVPAQLPAAVAGFTGRVRELRLLDAMLPAADGQRAAAVVISTVAGGAGVGKTALALHWCHRVARRFPDGQLYVNLRGYASSPPVPPIETLARFLRALGVPDDRVPADVDEAGALFRSLLAGRRVLILLDNAREAGQVRPLLPGSPGSLALVTSRDRLADLVVREGAHQLALDVLTDREAHDLLGVLLGAARTAAEPGATAELARLCGNLPLALRLAAANLATHPRAGIGEFVARLAGDRLAALEVGDPATGVGAAFDLSYAALDPDARRLFRLLGLAPGPDVTAPSAAALAGIDAPSAARLLDRLAAAHVVSEHAPGRYGLHDLLRAYAAERAAAEDGRPGRERALAELCRFLVGRADAAVALLYPEILRLPRPAGAAGAVAPFADREDALAWLDGEHDNLVAAVRAASAGEQAALAIHLADALRGYLLYRRSRLPDWQAVAEAALAAAAGTGEADLQAAAHLSAATLASVQGRVEDAFGHCRSAVAAARTAGWVDGEAAALNTAGVAHAALGQLVEAAEYLGQALALDRTTGGIDGAATRLGNLGSVQFFLGQLAQAAASYDEALALRERARSRSGIAHALADVALARHALGDLDGARAALVAALALYREVGARRGEAGALHQTAAVHRDAGDLAAARDLARQAVAMATEFDDSYVRADAVQTLASISHRMGRVDEAIDGYQQVIELARRVGHRFIEVEATVGLAAVHRAAGRLEAAGDLAAEALDSARRCGYRVLEGQATTVLAAVRLASGQAGLAADLAAEALGVHGETGHRLGEAQAHAVAGEALRAAGRDDESARHQAAARALLDEIGADAGVLLR